VVNETVSFRSVRRPPGPPSGRRQPWSAYSWSTTSHCSASPCACSWTPSHPSRTDDIATVRRLARPQRGPRLLEPADATLHTPRVLILTPAGHEGHAYAALRAGADGFLLEDAAPDELASAVRVVAAGDAVITPDLTRALIDAVRRQHTSHPLPRTSDLDTRTGRERDVLTAVASGWSNAEIAERLSIAPTTVKTHVSNILGKIGARARVQAVTFAYESGLVQPAA
jgi:DNA-binding NarL/FixJ family response regulator